jgi:hypothetical protein
MCHAVIWGHWQLVDMMMMTCGRLSSERIMAEDAVGKEEQQCGHL